MPALQLFCIVNLVASWLLRIFARVCGSPWLSTKFSKVKSTVRLCSNWSSELTFENFDQGTWVTVVVDDLIPVFPLKSLLWLVGRFIWDILYGTFHMGHFIWDIWQRSFFTWHFWWFDSDGSSQKSACCEMYSPGWLWLVGSIELQVSFAEYSLFYRALLQKRPIILSILLIEATPYYVRWSLHIVSWIPYMNVHVVRYGLASVSRID